MEGRSRGLGEAARDGVRRIARKRTQARRARREEYAPEMETVRQERLQEAADRADEAAVARRIAERQHAAAERTDG